MVVGPLTLAFRLTAIHECRSSVNLRSPRRLVFLGFIRAVWRPKGVQRRGGLCKCPTLRAEGGRFEPAKRRGRVTLASALESLCCKALRRSQAPAAATQNDPKKPGITRQNRDRSRFCSSSRKRAHSRRRAGRPPARREPGARAVTSSPRSPPPPRGARCLPMAAFPAMRTPWLAVITAPTLQLSAHGPVAASCRRPGRAAGCPEGETPSLRTSRTDLRDPRWDPPELATFP